LKLKRISYEDIGGLKDELQRVREMIALPMRHPSSSRNWDRTTQRVLLFGLRGQEKLLLQKR